ncbi:MAG: ferritin-like domain-containing protein [Immundisolibacterales bacterium]|nr:ferritin-like domain-containing protein [Immundisolibacterales bacterium]
MKRFISHEELARDSRFKRASSRGRLLESLPDDVDGVVALLEQVAPKLRERVKGTELEPVFDELGPGYLFLTQFGALRPEDPNVEVQLKMRLHSIFVGEMQALEGAGRTLWDFPDAPWEFRMNMARQCWDESRHCQVFEKLLDHVGVGVGDYPEATVLFEAACADDPTLRVAGVNRCLEGLACDAFRAMIEYAKEADDPVMEQAIDFVLADELTHVRFGSNWVKQFTRDNPEKFKEAKAFQREVERRFSVGSGRSGRGDATIGIAREERLEAGFTEEELREIAEIADRGPSRGTLVEAATVLKARHHARLRGEPVESIPGPAVTAAAD